MRRLEEFYTDPSEVRLVRMGTKDKKGLQWLTYQYRQPTEFGVYEETVRGIYVDRETYLGEVDEHSIGCSSVFPSRSPDPDRGERRFEYPTRWSERDKGRQWHFIDTYGRYVRGKEVLR